VAERAPQTDTDRDVADAPKSSPYPPAQEDPSKRGDYVAGGLYAPHIQDSVPAEIPDVDAIPEPEVKAEPRSRVGNRSYAVMGNRYYVRDSAEGYVEEGQASFYGKKFHGRLTSNQEVYDMYAVTAAHKTLPLPSYVRVTNLANGRSVVVRVNDRGPFHAGRIIDLSFAAATKLGFTKQGTARVEVRALTPGEGRGGRETAARTPPSAPPVATVEDHSVSADEFERWMRERGIRFAGVAPTTPLAAPASDDRDVLLQLASFSARDNAERARERLSAGGVEPLRIDEADVNGQPVWRLRIGPVPAARVQELSVRAADLGFGSAQIVRD
jgi:rare lipoprotein A